MELARSGRTTALVDADTVAPSLALLLGLSDDAPGIAAACRRAERGTLDATELTRLATTVATGGGEAVEVLAGINRPSRWPELGAARLRMALGACREWREETVVDVAGAFDADDEVTYDIAGPRRHAATSATLSEADLIVAVAAADPLGISRFLRDHAEVRRLTAPTRLSVVVNQVRPGPLGIDARGQVRRTLERFAGITDVTFLPFDQRAADASLLHARPMTDVTPRSTLVAGIRGLAATLSHVDAEPATDGSSRGSSRVARRLRSVLGLGERDESEVVRGRPVETRPLHQEDVLRDKQVVDQAASSRISCTFGSRRGNAYSAPCGLTHETPGIDSRPSHAMSRCSRRRPVGAISASMDCTPDSAACTACWAGTFGHSRVDASSVMPSMNPLAWPCGPVMTIQPER